MAIGAGLAAIGGWVTAGAATGIAASAIGGAIVGAVVGGLAAAITGGNILEGVLFGAVGGAVFGAAAGYLGGVGSAASGAGSGAGGASGLSTVGQGGVTSVTTGQGIGVGGTLTTTGSVGTATSTGGMLSGLGGSLAGSLKDIMGKGVEGGIDAYMQGEEAEAAMEYQSAEAEKAHERDLERMRLQAELSGGGGGGGSDGADLAYKARMAELDQRKHEFKTQTDIRREEWDTEQERKAARTGLFAGGGRAGGGGPAVEGKGIQEIRQEKGLAGTPGGAPITALTGPPEEEVA